MTRNTVSYSIKKIAVSITVSDKFEIKEYTYKACIDRTIFRRVKSIKRRFVGKGLPPLSYNDAKKRFLIINGICYLKPTVHVRYSTDEIEIDVFNTLKEANDFASDIMNKSIHKFYS